MSIDGTRSTSNTPDPARSLTAVEPKKRVPTQPSAARDSYKPTVTQTPVPGENVRTGLSVGISVLGPVPTAQQAITKIAPAVGHLAYLGPAARVAQRALAAVESIPSVAIALKGLGRVVPFIGAGILAFDGYAAYKTLKDPQASTKRKFLVSARCGFNAIATVLAFVPGWGMLASIPPSLASVGFDIAIKIMNGNKEP